MKELSAEMNRLVRKTILRLLRQEYPSPVDFMILWAALDNLGYPQDRHTLTQHIHYLQEKGLLRTETRTAYGQKIELCALTSKGWDLLDGLIESKGVL